MEGFWKDFKAFISKGNIIDLAVGVVIGAAFGKIVTSLVNDIIMPLITWALGATSLADLSIVLKRDSEGLATLTWNYGNFIQSIIDFLIIALCIFAVLRILMKSQDMFKSAIEKEVKSRPTKQEKKELKEQGINLKDKQAVSLALKTLREQKEKAKEKVVEVKPTQEQLLIEIRDLLKQNTTNNNHSNDNDSQKK